MKIEYDRYIVDGIDPFAIPVLVNEEDESMGVQGSNPADTEINDELKQKEIDS